MLASELRNQIDKMIEKYGGLRIVDEEGYEQGLGISFCSGDNSSMYNLRRERVKRQDYFMMFGQRAEFCDGFSKEIRFVVKKQVCKPQIKSRIFFLPNFFTSLDNCRQ